MKTVETRWRIDQDLYNKLIGLADKADRSVPNMISRMIRVWGTDQMPYEHPAHSVAGKSGMAPDPNTLPELKSKTNQKPVLVSDLDDQLTEPAQPASNLTPATHAETVQIDLGPEHYMYNPRPLPVGAPRFVELPRLREFEDFTPGSNQPNCDVKFLVRDDGFHTYRPAALVCEPMVWPTDVDIVYDAPERVPVVPHTIVDGGMPDYAWEQLKGIIDASVDDGTFDAKFPECKPKDIVAKILASEWMPNHVMTVRPDHEMGEKHIVD